MANLSSLPRILGAATAAYSVAVVLKPAVLAKPCGLADADGAIPPHVATAVRAVSVRDTIISVAMMTVPAGAPLRTAAVIRGLCDMSDAATFGLPVKDASMRTKIVAVGSAWGALCILSSRWA